MAFIALRGGSGFASLLHLGSFFRIILVQYLLLMNNIHLNNPSGFLIC